MQQSTANDFYERIVEGTDYEKTIELEHSSGETLKNVKMSPVDKTILADAMNSFPSDLFDTLEGADTPEEAEEMMEESDQDVSLSAMNADTISAFERLVSESLSHDDLTNTQMQQIVEALDFSMLFEIGGDVIDISFSDGEAIKDFRAQE